MGNGLFEDYVDGGTKWVIVYYRTVVTKAQSG